MKITCFGDSITLGQIGAPYVDYLNGEVENTGVNGLTTTSELDTVSNWLFSNSLDSVDVFILAIGSNDLIGPFLKTQGWKDYYETGEGSKQVYLEDPAQFAVVYESIVQKLTETGKPVILVCPPHLQLEGFDTLKEVVQDERIKEIGEKYSLPVVDTKSAQLAFFGKEKYHKTNSARNNYLIGVALTLLGMLPVNDTIFPLVGKTYLTVDGIHSSKETAKLEGKCINDALANI